MTIAFVLFDEFLNNLGKKLIDLSGDTFKAVLSNTAPTQATDDELADITQIANGNGYTTGGEALTTVSWAETAGGSGIWEFTSDALAWTAAGGAIATFRYLVIYDDTSAGDKLVGFVDLGGANNIIDGAVVTITPPANGYFRLSHN